MLRARIKDEIHATFSSQFNRDEFASKGRLLGNDVDGEGKPTAGFHLDVPDYLAADFKAVNDCGFPMRNVHGRETRKYIKYDDENYSLFLELKPLPSLKLNLIWQGSNATKMKSIV